MDRVLTFLLLGIEAVEEYEFLPLHAGRQMDSPGSGPAMVCQTANYQPISALQIWRCRFPSMHYFSFYVVVVYEKETIVIDGHEVSGGMEGCNE